MFDNTDNTAIQELMRAQAPEHDREWLKNALQAAVTLEFATIPPYLCGLWSIKNDTHPVANSIREVLQEEMLHMALVCNMLVAIGGTPQINTPEAVPKYPALGLPGGVKPDLVVSLSGLTDDSLATFMAIEEPEEDLSVELESVETFARIGVFYDAIEQAFVTISQQDPTFTLSTDRQIAGPLSKMVVRNIEDVHKAIETIKVQGEGSTMSPEETGLDDLAHYYRFKEILLRKKIVYVPTNPEKERWVHSTPIEFPEVWPMAVVPAGGYQQADVSEAVWYWLSKCDQAFTVVLNHLQSTWENGDQACFWHAIEMMFKLEESAKSLMEIPLPEGNGTYGPCFRLVS